MRGSFRILKTGPPASFRCSRNVCSSSALIHHRPEFVHLEAVAIPAKTLLIEEYRPAIHELDRESNDEKQRRQNGQTQRGADNVDEPFQNESRIVLHRLER